MQANRKPSRTKFIATACILVSELLLGLQAHAACTNKSLSGAFGFLVHGTNLTANVQFAISGRFTADGNGSFKGNAIQNVAGKISHVPFQGEYEISAECSGSSRFTFTNGESANLEFTLVDNGNELLIMIADEGTIEFGTAKKQFHGTDANSKLKGRARH